jgi:hypothetical protein
MTFPLQSLTRFGSHRRNSRRRSPVRPTVELRHAEIQQLEPRTLLAVQIHTVDVLFGYTTAALTSAGSVQNLTNTINRAVANLNQALTNSQIPESVRTVGILPVAGYTSTGNSGTDLTNLQSGTNADLVKLRGTDRTAYGADLVDLVTTLPNGRADIPASATPSKSMGFSVSTITSPVLIMHEIGHTLGAGHARQDPTGSAADPEKRDEFPYGHDYVVPPASSSGVSYGTLMAGWDIPFFSNPNVQYQGTAVGVADTAKNSADNAKAMSKLAAVISKYEPTAATYADKTGPSAGLADVEQVTGSSTINIRVIYYDPSGVDVTSLGDSNLQVTGAGLSSASAKFLGLSTKAGGDPSAITAVTSTSVDYPVVVANYAVTGATLNSNLSALTIKLAANQVKDQLGNAAPAGDVQSASGNPLINAAGILPTFAGPAVSPSRYTTGLAADLGDLSNRSVRITDFFGARTYPNFSTSTNAYRFSLAADTKFTININATGTPLDVNVYQDVGNTGSISGRSSSLSSFNALNFPFTNGGTFSFKATANASAPGGQNYYYLVVRDALFNNSGTKKDGDFTLTLTPTK